MASAPSFMSRLFRPFTTGTARFNPESSAQKTFPDGTQKCTIAAGCFWGPDHMYSDEFKGKGLLDTSVGYIGGDMANPGYRAVCSGRTGHAEALQMHFDPSKVTYRQLLEYFYKMHDPTQYNRQGPDTGTQYRSAIFYHNDEQERIAKTVTEKVQNEWYKNGKIATEVAPAGQWWDAEDYHQKYLTNQPGGYECPSHFVRKFPPLSD
ncbi:MAG: Peptide-methionine (S)-S-oxide reductase [Chrysothrix sp. TS-e1954]|nr:MAG: Peptide-methionine (S)-S-oxide reductase [Chrysothrix sp. TS-e1954]